MRCRGLLSALLLAALAAAPAALAADVPVVVAVDTSRSLRPAELAATSDHLRAVLTALPDDVPAGLIAFDDEARWVLPVGTPGREVAAALPGLAPAGSVTLLNDALFLAVRALPDGGVVLLATDGRDEGSATTVEDVARFAERHRVRLLPLATGREVDERALRRLALLTGGSYLGRASAEAVARSVSTVREEVAADAAASPREEAAPEATAAQPAVTPAPTTPPPGAASPTATASRDGGNAWWWLLVPLALLLAVPIGLALRRRRTEQAFFCPRCGSDLASPQEECARCRDDELRSRLVAVPVAQLEDTAELAVTTPLDVRSSVPSGSLEVTRVLTEQHALFVREGDRPPRSYLLRYDAGFGIGRDSDNTLALRDPALSAHHLKIVADDGRFHVVDLGSTNGTYHNGERVEMARLRSGDVVRAGQTELEYRIMTTPAG